jgi:hypothetical protein
MMCPTNKLISNQGRYDKAEKNVDLFEDGIQSE